VLNHSRTINGAWYILGLFAIKVKGGIHPVGHNEFYKEPCPEYSGGNAGLDQNGG